MMCITVGCSHCCIYSDVIRTKREISSHNGISPRPIRRNNKAACFTVEMETELFPLSTNKACRAQYNLVKHNILPKPVAWMQCNGIRELMTSNKCVSLLKRKRNNGLCRTRGKASVMRNFLLQA